jgi:ATP-dependent DNA helicase RecG
VIDAFDPVDRLPGVGAAARTALGEHGIHAVTDIVWTPPVGWDDLSAPLDLRAAVDAARLAPDGRSGRVALRAIVKSAAVVPIRGRRSGGSRTRRSARLVVSDVTDESCKVHVFWFFLAHGALAVAKPGASVLLVGRVVISKDGKKTPARMAHPDVFADTVDVRTVRPRYARLGLSGAAFRKAIAHAVGPDGASLAPDPVPAAIAAREKMRGAAEILREVHAVSGVMPTEDARRAFVERLAWAEGFARVWERVERAEGARGPGTRLPRSAETIAAVAAELGFAWTTDQRAAIDTIAQELDAERPMRRLLLGDVGTGKTAVALAAVAQCVAAGRSAAILAPTTVLADQYTEAVRPLVRALGPERCRVAFVSGELSAAERRRVEAALARGESNVAIGTHALLGEKLAMRDLALVIVDEQQRLGVAQRLALVGKGEGPHMLTLSATPIPRTLALALRGDLGTSILRERPEGRSPAETTLAPRSTFDAVVRRAAEACDRGERVFWVVPRVALSADDDDDDELASATARAKALRGALGEGRVLLLHGKMTAADKRASMAAFRGGEVPLLVATTVIEVGVDVPDATLMVVEDAEQFGLAQLHQLRGRVGRGDRPGACVLLHAEPLVGLAKARLEALAVLSSGEEIARADLELRGAGDLGGTRQHGAADELVYLDANVAYDWLERIEGDVRAIRAADPGLTRPEHRALASLVRRFGRAIELREAAG